MNSKQRIMPAHTPTMPPSTQNDNGNYIMIQTHLGEPLWEATLTFLATMISRHYCLYQRLVPKGDTHIPLPQSLDEHFIRVWLILVDI